MGHIRVVAIFYNAINYVKWVRGELSEANVRRVEVETLVDTGATFPALPKDLIGRLGLTFLREVDSEVASDSAKHRLYGLAIVQIEDRIAECPVIERPEGTTPVIGVVALKQMGFRVDPIKGKLIKGLPLMLTLVNP